MANYFLQTLIPLALLLISSHMLVRSQDESTSFTYDFYGDQPTSLTYQGDAHFSSDTTFLRLTRTNADGVPQGYSIGRVMHTVPVLFQALGAQADFETTLKFIINGANPGDGLTFFIAPVGYNIPPGSTGGSFGIFDPSNENSPVFAVEFDTVTNPWDPGYRHVGIDVGSLVSANTTRVDGAIIGQEVTARISYVGATKLISVRVAAGSQVFELSSVHDLGTLLPEQVQVGISAATGALVANHDVVSWYFTSTLVHIGAAAQSEGSAHIRQIV